MNVLNISMSCLKLMYPKCVRSYENSSECLSYKNRDSVAAAWCKETILNPVGMFLLVKGSKLASMAVTFHTRVCEARSLKTVGQFDSLRNFVTTCKQAS